MPADDTNDANSYTRSEGAEYARQGQRNSQPGRQHADFAPKDDIGGTQQLKPGLPPDAWHYAQESADPIRVKRDAYNNEIPVDRTNHEPMPAESGEWGGRQYSDYQKADGYSGYGVEIPHGQSAAFNKAETVWVDNSKADRGRDS